MCSPVFVQQTVNETYLSEASSVSLTRRQVDKALQAWGHDELCDTAQMLISEMATNAVRHCTGATFSVNVSLAEDSLCLAVQDSSPRLPQVNHSDDDQENGRGMMIITMIADTWGVHEHASGKTVWAHLGLS